jgi:hypothetical protein
VFAFEELLKLLCSRRPMRRPDAFEDLCRDVR